MQTVLIILLILAGLALILTGLYLFLIMPRLRKPAAGAAPLTTSHFAHRGYFTEEEKKPQNTLAAFARAAEAGYGMELDVHLTKDNRLAVIHDHHLGALCGYDGIVEDMTLEELKRLRVHNTVQTIPTLREVLNTVNGRTPLLVETKGVNVEPLMPLVMAELDNYNGLYCIESFNPLHLRWLKKHRPEVLRGQLACKNGWQKEKNLKEKLKKFASEKLLCNFLSRPDFIAYSYPDARMTSVRLNKKMGAVIAGWTIRDEEGLAESKANGVTVQIFEKIHP